MIQETYSTFFRDLQKNNTKEWFHTNKKRYENDVKAPFLKLLNDLIPFLRAWDEHILPDPKKALFRINRDLRFSKDKSPYHLIMKAGLSPGGKKSIYPGYYLGIDEEHVNVGGGLFMLRPPELKKVRQYIALNTDKLTEIIQQHEFVESFGKLRGEKAKRIDKGLLETAKKTDLIYNKQFYAFAEFPLARFYNTEALTGEILDHFKLIRPLNSYFNNAFH